MKITIKHLDTDEIETLEVSNFTENSYTIKGRGIFTVSFKPGTVEITQNEEP